MTQYRFSLAIDQHLSLVTPTPNMALELYELVARNREHIAKFLPWAKSMLNAQMEEGFNRKMMLESAQGTGQFFLIAYDNQIIGTIDFHNVQRETHQGEIGYWLDEAFNGQDIMTKTVNFLIQYAFEVLNFNKVTLQAVVENIASNKVALKCGFELVGVKHQDFLLYDKLCDMNLYEKLRG